MEGLRPWLRLVHAPGVGPARTRTLLAQHGHAEAIAAAPAAELRAAGLPAPAIAVLHGDDAPTGIERDLEWGAAAEQHLLPLTDPRYPAALAASADPPPLLYVQGDPEVLTLPGVAIVGTRNPTPSGRETAHAFARHLGARGLAVASGLAIGIDGAAHGGALAAATGPTFAVAGTGLDRVYPARHADLARRIAAQGALVSELPVGTRPSREAFPRRNRLLSALTTGTLVVEAAVRSGSLITARFALEQGREVFAIPGSIHNPVARGCHRLIRQGAKLVETADDILEELAPLLGDRLGAAAPAAEAGEAPSAEAPAPAGDCDYGRLRAALDWQPRGVDELAAASELDAATVASMLLRLELEGSVQVLPGGLYQRP